MIKNIIQTAIGYNATIDGTSWSGITPASRFYDMVQEAIAEGAVVAVEQPMPMPSLLEQQQAARAEAYRTEADPLYFKTQRGEATIEEWQTKVAEIKARYPYPI